jgi:ATP-dependent DNA ligase
VHCDTVDVSVAYNLGDAYILVGMTFEFCIPTRSTIVPDGPDWFHEIKYDGYRLRLERCSFDTGGFARRT